MVSNPSDPRTPAVVSSHLEAQALDNDPSLRQISFVTPRGKPVTLRYKQRARSVGSSARGHLENGRCLPEKGPGFVRFSKAGCGTDETATLVMFALGEMLATYPDIVPVVIGALSMPTGGRIKPHKSHRSGRDIDFGFFREGNVPLSRFEDIPFDRIDYERSFSLMANLIATGRVQSIYVNYALEKHLVKAASDMGYDDEQLSWLFQYPRGRGSKVGLIRHEKGHTRHFHVRFVCPVGDDSCREN